MNTIVPQPQGGQAGSSLDPATLRKIDGAAHAFEAMALGQLLEPMFQTVDQSKTMFGGGDGEAAWRPMWINALAKQMEANGGIGLARPVMQQMIQMQEQRGAAQP